MFIEIPNNIYEIYWKTGKKNKYYLSILYSKNRKKKNINKKILKIFFFFITLK
jgi:uncharacterized membrane protein